MTAEMLVPDKRGLVLGGGGLTGTGWLIGVLAGLLDEGVSLSDADLTVGTSCGALVAAQLTHGADPRELYEGLLARTELEPSLQLPLSRFTELAELIVSSPDLQVGRARVGQAAIKAASLTSQAQLTASITAQVDTDDWPAGELAITAVDAGTGEFVAFDRTCGSSLTDAVVASCSLPFVYEPAQVGGRRWIDGFIRSPANVDVAGGCARIVTLAPMLQGFAPINTVPQQVRELQERTGALMITLSEDARAAAIADDRMDPQFLAPVAEAGFAQGSAAAEDVAKVWSGVSP